MEAKQITTAQIKALRCEARERADQRMVDYCCVALGEYSQVGGTPGSASGWTVSADEARAVCAKAVSDAEAMDDGE